MTDPNGAIEFIYKHAPLYAQAQSECDRLYEVRKSIKAVLMLHSEEKSAIMKEAEAHASPQYNQNIEEYKTQQQIAITLKWQLEAAKLKIDVWRSENASNRFIDRAAQ